jgi:hypothetical protein
LAEVEASEVATTTTDRPGGTAVSTTTTPAVPATTPSVRRAPVLASALANKPLWLVGVASTVLAAVVTSLVAAVAKAGDVPLQVASSSGSDPETIPTAGFATMVLIMGAVGVVLALAVARWAKRPARTFVVVTAVLTIASFASPLIAYEATTATRLVLELTHVVAAAIVIPPIAYRLAHQQGR